MSNEITKMPPVCNSECLKGRCPHKKCVKYICASPSLIKDIELRVLTSAKRIPKFAGAKAGFGIAADIGSTTLALTLYNLATGKPLAQLAGANRQLAYGADVISRIMYCKQNISGLYNLNEILIKQINEMIYALSETVGISVAKVSHLAVCANTVMSCIFAGISPVSMGEYPFDAPELFGISLPCADLKLDLNAQCYIAPCISSFVGGDITAGLSVTNCLKLNRIAYVDIGTNGEIAVIEDGVVSVAAAAAGPAFEGAGITFGMAAAPGAIYEVNDNTGVMNYRTIDGVAPVGITGSGLIDAIAVFLNKGVLDKSGRIKTKLHFTRKCKEEDGLYITDKIYLSQKDIREFQTAKAAIAAGIMTLCEISGFKPNELNELLLAGGFGNYMDADSAKTVGLIPSKVRTVPVGNAALYGAAVFLTSETSRESAQELAKNARPYNLADNTYFMDAFVGCMQFNRI